MARMVRQGEVASATRVFEEMPEQQMKGTGSQKSAGLNWIEPDEAFHEFTAGDRKYSRLGPDI